MVEVFMNRWQRISLILCVFAFISGFFGPVTLPVGSQAVGVQTSVGQSGEIVRIIVQKSSQTNQVEQYIEKLGGKVTKDLSIINAVAAEIPSGQLATLRQYPGVRWVSLDSPIVSSKKPDKDSDPTPLPENYYLDTLGVRQVWDMGYQGEGVTVAVIDSGIFLDRDFSFNPGKSKTRILVQMSFNSGKVVDKFGHGTHVAGIIGGTGEASDGLYAGIAPLVNFVNLKIMNDEGMAYESDTVEAMQWIFDNKETYNIRVVNLSIQSTVEQSYHSSPLAAAAEILWFNGVVVVTTAGNWVDGFNPIQAPPANDPFLITVGAVDENDTSDRQDDFLASFSAYGLTQDCCFKPELVAPGQDIISVLSLSSEWRFEYPERVIMDTEYFRLSGTSMSAPMVSGAIALLLQAEPELTPDQVKYRLIHSTDDQIGGSAYLDIFAALTTSTTESANTGLEASQLLWTGEDPVQWDSVNWGSVNWGSVNWGSVNWGSVNWGSVNWGSLYWDN
jgi:serine protease AprX